MQAWRCCCNKKRVKADTYVQTPLNDNIPLWSGNNIGHSQSHACTQRRTSLQLSGVHSFPQKWLSLHALFSPVETTRTPRVLLSHRQSVAANNLKMNANPRPISCVQTRTVSVTMLAALSFSLPKSCITSLVVKAHVSLWQSRASVTRHSSMQMLSDTSQHTLKRITWKRTRNISIQKNGPTILLKSETTKAHLEKRMKPHSKADSMTPNATKHAFIHRYMTYPHNKSCSLTHRCLTSDT